MSKGKLEHFHVIEDLKETIDKLIEEHRDAKNNKLGVMFRVAIPPNTPTMYTDGYQGPYQLVEGVRVCDYKFDKATGFEWVLADRTCGLSFSKTYSHLKNKRKMLKRHARGYKKPGPANVAWWILGDFHIPEGLEFVQDPGDKHHYFLAVTQRMHVSKLIDKLKEISFHMTIMHETESGF